jgi:hypothetical protein
MSGRADRPNDRCDKCGAHVSEWDKKPCVQGLTQSPRHTITRFHIPIPAAVEE